MTKRRFAQKCVTACLHYQWFMYQIMNFLTLIYENIYEKVHILS